MFKKIFIKVTYLALLMPFLFGCQKSCSGISPDDLPLDQASFIDLNDWVENNPLSFSESIIANIPLTGVASISKDFLDQLSEIDLKFQEIEKIINNNLPNANFAALRPELLAFKLASLDRISTSLTPPQTALTNIVKVSDAADAAENGVTESLNFTAQVGIRIAGRPEEGQINALANQIKDEFFSIYGKLLTQGFNLVSQGMLQNIFRAQEEIKKIRVAPTRLSPALVATNNLIDNALNNLELNLTAYSSNLMNVGVRESGAPIFQPIEVNLDTAFQALRANFSAKLVGADQANALALENDLELAIGNASGLKRYRDKLENPLDQVFTRAALNAALFKNAYDNEKAKFYGSLVALPGALANTSVDQLLNLLRKASGGNYELDQVFASRSFFNASAKRANNDQKADPNKESVRLLWITCDQIFKKAARYSKKPGFEMAYFSSQLQKIANSYQKNNEKIIFVFPGNICDVQKMTQVAKKVPSKVIALFTKDVREPVNISSNKLLIEPLKIASLISIGKKVCESKNRERTPPKVLFDCDFWSNESAKVLRAFANSELSVDRVQTFFDDLFEQFDSYGDPSDAVVKDKMYSDLTNKINVHFSPVPASVIQSANLQAKIPIIVETRVSRDPLFYVKQTATFSSQASIASQIAASQASAAALQTQEAQERARRLAQLAADTISIKGEIDQQINVVNVNVVKNNTTSAFQDFKNDSDKLVGAVENLLSKGMCFNLPEVAPGNGQSSREFFIEKVAALDVNAGNSSDKTKIDEFSDADRFMKYANKDPSVMGLFPDEAKYLSPNCFLQTPADELEITGKNNFISTKSAELKSDADVALGQVSDNNTLTGIQQSFLTLLESESLYLQDQNKKQLQDYSTIAQLSDDLFPKSSNWNPFDKRPFGDYIQAGTVGALEYLTFNRRAWAFMHSKYAGKLKDASIPKNGDNELYKNFEDNRVLLTELKDSLQGNQSRKIILTHQLLAETKNYYAALAEVMRKFYDLSIESQNEILTGPLLSEFFDFFRKVNDLIKNPLDPNDLRNNIDDPAILYANAIEQIVPPAIWSMLENPSALHPRYLADMALSVGNSNFGLPLPNGLKSLDSMATPISVQENTDLNGVIANPANYYAADKAKDTGLRIGRHLANEQLLSSAAAFNAPAKIYNLSNNLVSPDGSMKVSGFNANTSFAALSVDEQKYFESQANFDELKNVANSLLPLISRLYLITFLLSVD